jgi:NADP-dependent 3-hydroxy acid dehydrogenase YdfG
MNKKAVVTGAGSGVGQATALKLVFDGWRVAILGRREEALKETVEKAGAAGKQMLICVCDIGDEAAVAATGTKILAEFGEVELLVNAAGTNVPKRGLAVLSSADYHSMMNANLNGAYYCAQAFLANMRQRKSGTIVNIVSDAGKKASPKAGPAYVMSKYGMAGLNDAINAEERPNGIRACAIFPGDIDTPLLNKRPSPPPPEARQRMMTAEDIADCVLFVARLPARAVVEEMIVRPL